MITMTVGIGLRGQIRKGLEILQFEKEIDSFLETKSFLESEFRVKGATRVAVRRMEHWNRQINQPAS